MVCLGSFTQQWHRRRYLAFVYSKICVKRSLSKKRTQVDFQDQLLLNAGQKYCRMLQGEHSAILLTFIKLPFVIKIFALSIFKWLFYTGFTVCSKDSGLFCLFFITSPMVTLMLCSRSLLKSVSLHVIY